MVQPLTILLLDTFCFLEAGSCPVIFGYITAIGPQSDTVDEWPAVTTPYF